MDPTGIQSFPPIFSEFFPFTWDPIPKPGRWTCGFRWALFGKALPKKFAEKHLAFAEVSRECPGRHVKMWRCLTPFVVDLYNSKKKQLAATFWLKPMIFKGVGNNLCFLVFFSEWYAVSSTISLRPPRIFFTTQVTESLDTYPMRLATYKEFFSEIHLYKQRFLEKSKPFCAFACTVNANNHPPKKNRGKTVNEKK